MADSAAFPGDGGILDMVPPAKFEDVFHYHSETKALGSLFFALLGSHPATAQASQLYVDSGNAL